VWIFRGSIKYIVVLQSWVKLGQLCVSNRIVGEEDATSHDEGEEGGECGKGQQRQEVRKTENEHRRRVAVRRKARGRGGQ